MNRLAALGCVACLLLAGQGTAGGAEPTSGRARGHGMARALYAEWGAEALERIEEDLRVPETDLYAQWLKPNGKRGNQFGQISFVWPAGFQLRALAAAAKAEPGRYLDRLVGYADALQRYWEEKDGVGGYMVLVTRSERFYDDNAWLALGLIETFERSGEKRFLERAQQVIDLLLSGEKKTAGGGIRQREGKAGGAFTCTTAPAAVAALRLYRVLGDAKYLEMGKRWHAWLVDPKVGVRDPETGLYHQGALWADGAWKVKRGYRAYQTALPLEAALELYAVEKDDQFLAEAQTLADLAVGRWIQPSGAMSETAQWGGSDLTDALLDLYDVDGDARWMEAVDGALRFLHDFGRDSHGWYGERWDADHRHTPVKECNLLHMAPAARAFWRAACEPARSSAASGPAPAAWDSTRAYSAGQEVECGGRVWRAREDVPADYPLLGAGDGSPADRSFLLSRAEGFGESATGGLKGKTYHVVNADDDPGNPLPGSLRYGAQSADPLWIVFDGDYEIHLAAEIKVTGDKTIDGRGRKVLLTGHGLSGLVMDGVGNVIVENLILRDFGDVARTRFNDPDDAIRIQNRSHDVWIDHCDLSVAGDKLVAVNDGCTSITVSWNHFHDQQQVFQIGAMATQAGDAEQTVTVHHNFFDGTGYRHPVVSYGRVHAYNNYLYHWQSYGMGAIRDAQLYSENNIFEAGDNTRATNHNPGNGYNDARTRYDPRHGFIRSEGDLRLNDAKIRRNEPDKVFDPHALYVSHPQPADDALKRAVAEGAGWIAGVWEAEETRTDTD